MTHMYLGKRVRRQVQYFQPGQEEVTAFDDDQEYQGDDGPHAGSDNEYQGDSYSHSRESLRNESYSFNDSSL